MVLTQIRKGIEPQQLRIKSIILTVFLLTAVFSKSQDQPMDYKNVDKRTYNLFQYKNWDKLIMSANEALEHKIDYFYLRLRLGIAYFKTKNYFQAVSHLEKALEFNSSDQTALEYLYLAYHYSNRSTEATKARSKFNTDLGAKYPKKVIQQVDVFSGPVFSNNIRKNEKESLLNGTGLSSQQDLNDSKYFNRIGVMISPLKWASVYLGYSNLTTKKLKQIETSELVKTGTRMIESIGFSYLDTLYGLNYELHEDKYTINQNSIYFSTTISPATGWTISPAAHLLLIDYKTIFVDGTAEEYFAQSYDTIPSVKIVYSVNEKIISFTDYILSFSVSKTIKNITLGGNFSYSALNGSEQIQAGGSFTWFPAGNLDLYFDTKINSSWQGKEDGLIFDQLAGLKIAKPLWLEGRFVVGDQLNYNESNGNVVFNSGDILKFRTNARIILILKPGLDISFGYQFMRFNSYRYAETIQLDVKTETIEYSNNLLIGGIKWSF